MKKTNYKTRTLKQIALSSIDAIAPVALEPVNEMTIWTLVQIWWQDGTRMPCSARALDLASALDLTVLNMPGVPLLDGL